uniref:Uncharacterized protein n=1 Tax=Parascaris univalens TaxID=6257 RepID=A0A914ZVP9_PARUN
MPQIQIPSCGIDEKSLQSPIHVLLKHKSAVSNQLILTTTVLPILHFIRYARRSVEPR